MFRAVFQRGLVAKSVVVGGAALCTGVALSDSSTSAKAMLRSQLQELQNRLQNIESDLGAEAGSSGAGAENEKSGEQFKAELKAGKTKYGLFINSASPLVAEQLSFSGYDWLLVDTQHGPMNPNLLSTMLAGISAGKAKSMVRVAAFDDRAGIQQALDAGADGVLVPYINTAEEAREAVSACLYPTAGTRSVYFPQRSMNPKGLLGYAGTSNKNVIIAMQVETASCIKNIDEIAAVPGVDMLFLGQNDLCMSMGLYEKYEFPHMYTSPELNAATKKLITAARRNGKILGLFLFGTDRVEEFLNKGFTFVSIGNDLHHVLTSNQAHITSLENIGNGWKHQPSSIVN